jgi:integrase/recombinase XerD
MPDDASAQPTSAHLTTRSLLTPTITAWQYYLEDQGQSINTIKAFTADVRLLAGYLPPDRPIGLISTNELNNFFIWMQRGRGVPCSPKTLARRITSIKAFFRWLHAGGVLLVDPAEKVVQKSVLSPLPAVLTPSETKLALEAADRQRTAQKPDARPYTLFSLIIQTGIKKSECLALRLNHIDLEAPGGPILFIRYTSPSYRYKERKIPLSNEWIEVYQEYASQYPSQDKLFPWSQRRLEYLLEDISREAGLEKHISFEMCRWTCALRDWKSGMERDKIRQKLGISKIQWREVRMKLKRLAAETLED